MSGVAKETNAPDASPEYPLDSDLSDDYEDFLKNTLSSATAVLDRAAPQNPSGREIKDGQEDRRGVKKSSSTGSSAESSSSGLSESSPAARFRKNRPLTVTDLSGSTQCELQHLFNLVENDGALFRTVEMKAGSKYHEELENELFEFEQVSVSTREDWFAVKLWNTAQAFHALRLIGQTREVSLFGVLDGQVVSGVIDGITVDSPAKDFEKKLGRRANAVADAPQVYICETKTRRSERPPPTYAIVSAFKQVLIYRVLLQQMLFGPDISATVFERYNLNPQESLSEQTENDLLESPIKKSEARRLRPLKLYKIWELMIQQGQAAIASPEALSNILTVDFEHVETKEQIARHHVVYHPDRIDKFVSDKISFWTGMREARGVDIEDAHWCQRCRYAENCEWRIERAGRRSAGGST